MPGAGRAKLSTTVENTNLQYLESLVRRGDAHSLAEAVDRAVRLLRKIENRRKLEHDTANYFEGLVGNAAQEENSLAASLHSASEGIDYDLEA